MCYQGPDYQHLSTILGLTDFIFQSALPGSWPVSVSVRKSFIPAVTKLRHTCTQLGQSFPRFVEDPFQAVSGFSQLVPRNSASSQERILDSAMSFTVWPHLAYFTGVGCSFQHILLVANVFL